MGQLTVRNLENVVKAKLHGRAKRHGRSMEEEVRDILRSVAKKEDVPAGGLGTEIAGVFAKARPDADITEPRGHQIRPASFR